MEISNQNKLQLQNTSQMQYTELGVRATNSNDPYVPHFNILRIKKFFFAITV